MADVDDIIRFIFTGDRGAIPRNATHFTTHESLSVIPRNSFYNHRKIIELICHANVKRIGISTCMWSKTLKRLEIEGVEVVEQNAFWGCSNLENAEFPKVKIVRQLAFSDCISLGYIDLPSIKIVENNAFTSCELIKYANFGKDLESLRAKSLAGCHNLERITIPLKHDVISSNDVFEECINLKYVHLIEEEVLRETIDALLLDEWRNDMNQEVDVITQILPYSHPGHPGGLAVPVASETTVAIREWINSVLSKIIQYKAMHRQLLKEAAPILRQSLRKNIITNNVLSFLELPSHTFDGEENEEVGSYFLGDDSDGESNNMLEEEDNREETVGDDGRERRSGRKRRRES